MQKIHEEYLTDENGNKKAVIVPISEWQHIKEDLEVLDDIRAYDKAKSKPSEPVPFNEAIQYKKRVPNIYSCLISTKSQNPLKPKALTPFLCPTTCHIKRNQRSERLS